ncbi:hypothetical protein [Lentilactobacillus sp. Marseille-Q4993]|uniref:hypothetical protein n=1 Tax=Lentilactobacillus sp. Marseille-Q4993 TaxID=3039492 RepID=UPI0024BC5ED3|nr:hypothetical protein [Lentilactobacillus sp. Marseille-Q4993]
MKKRLLIITLGLLALGFGATSINPTTANASQRYYWMKTKQVKNVPFHTDNTVPGGYIYNATHTQKVHKLSNFPHTTWYVTKKISMRPSNTQNRYLFYYVQDGKGNQGVVWHNYLKAGAAHKAVDMVTASKHVSPELISDKYISLSRSIKDSAMTNIAQIVANYELEQYRANPNFDVTEANQNTLYKLANQYHFDSTNLKVAVVKITGSEFINIAEDGYGTTGTSTEFAHAILSHHFNLMGTMGISTNIISDSNDNTANPTGIMTAFVWKVNK